MATTPEVGAVEKREETSPITNGISRITTPEMGKETTPNSNGVSGIAASEMEKDTAPTAGRETVVTAAVEVAVREPEKLSDAEYGRVEKLKQMIDEYYNDVPRKLKNAPEAQERCLKYLNDAESALIPPLKRCEIIRSRLILTRVQIELSRAEIAKSSFFTVSALVYMFVIIVSLAFQTGILQMGVTGKDMHEKLIMGIPTPILIWSVLGTMTSMLLRAGQLPFANPSEAHRWLLFRPIVGVVMGLLTYLMVTAGLIVFAGTSETKTPELLWIIAFVGSFSDTLSINLLQKVIGTFQTVETGNPPSESSRSPQVKLMKESSSVTVTQQ